MIHEILSSNYYDSAYWQYGYKQAVDESLRLQDRYEKIVVTIALLVLLILPVFSNLDKANTFVVAKSYSFKQVNKCNRLLKTN